MIFATKGCPHEFSRSLLLYAEGAFKIYLTISTNRHDCWSVTWSWIAINDVPTNRKVAQLKSTHAYPYQARGHDSLLTETTVADTRHWVEYHQCIWIRISRRSDIRCYFTSSNVSRAHLSEKGLQGQYMGKRRQVNLSGSRCPSDIFPWQCVVKVKKCERVVVTRRNVWQLRRYLFIGEFILYMHSTRINRSCNFQPVIWNVHGWNSDTRTDNQIEST